MIFSEDYKKKLHSNKQFAKEIRNEVCSGLIVEKYIYGKELMLGDDPSLRLPDLYAEDYSIGYELVRCDLTCDFKWMDSIKIMAECGGDEDEIKKRLAAKEIVPDEYSFLKRKNGLVYSLYPKKLYTMGENFWGDFISIIEKKLKKLKNGRYDFCCSKNLIVSSTLRERGEDTAQCITKIYRDVYSKYGVSFNNVYLITIKGVYAIYPRCKELKHFGNEYFNEIGQEMRKMLNLQ